MSDLEIATQFAVVEGKDGDASFIFATLFFLDSENGHEALWIPEDDDETDVILCYIGENVVYLEHEQEEGKDEEWHLHMRPQKEAWKRAPKVITILSS